MMVEDNTCPECGHLKHWQTCSESCPCSMPWPEPEPVQDERRRAIVGDDRDVEAARYRLHDDLFNMAPPDVTWDRVGEMLTTFETAIRVPLEAEVARLRAIEWESREGMVTVYDHEGHYLGCMGVNAWAQRLRAEVEGKDEVCECGRTRRGSELHCWRVGGHLETGCGCETHSLDFEPRGLEHYFKPAEPTTQGAPAEAPKSEFRVSGGWGSND